MDPIDHVPPVTRGGLPEEPHRGIPRRIVPRFHPTPVCRIGQEHPHRFAKGPREMTHRGVDTNHEIQLAYGGSGVTEIIQLCIQRLESLWKPECFGLPRRSSFLVMAEGH